MLPAATRLLPNGTAAEMVTPQHVYLRLHNDDGLIAKPRPVLSPSLSAP
jgi:hypothetical protein